MNDTKRTQNIIDNTITVLENNNIRMAEAMINHEYLATSLPTLQPSEGRGGMIIESNHNNNNNKAVEESERSCGKSVVFDLPPSPKRQKISTTTTKMLYSSNDNKLTYQMIITSKYRKKRKKYNCIYNVDLRYLKCYHYQKKCNDVSIRKKTKDNKTNCQ